jgi:hypothetical protein
MTVATDAGREELVFGHRIDWDRTNSVKFEQITAPDARRLLEDGYMSPAATSGGSPTMAAVVEFCERWGDEEPQRDGEISVHGRVVAPDDPDAGVYVEGVRYTGPTSNAFVRAFADAFAEADSFMLEKNLHARCWFA